MTGLGRHKHIINSIYHLKNLK